MEHTKKDAELSDGKISRRSFIKSSLMYIGGAAVASKLSPAGRANVRGANNDIRDKIDVLEQKAGTQAD